MSQIVALQAQQPTGSLAPQNIADAMKLAEIMSTGKLLPAHLQGKPGDCLMVIEQAIRWGMSPFAVAQATSVIQGKLMFEGKLVAAAVHASGILAGRLSYDFAGTGDARKVTVKGTLKGEGAPREVEVILRDAKTGNQLWTKQPDQQLVYHGTRVWARRHAPEVMLGVYSPDEMDEAPHVGPERAKDVTPSQPVHEPQNGSGKITVAQWTAGAKQALEVMQDGAEYWKWVDESQKYIALLRETPKYSVAWKGLTEAMAVTRERVGIVDEPQERVDPDTGEVGEASGGRLV